MTKRSHWRKWNKAALYLAERTGFVCRGMRIRIRHADSPEELLGLFAAQQPARLLACARLVGNAPVPKYAAPNEKPEERGLVRLGVTRWILACADHLRSQP